MVDRLTGRELGDKFRVAITEIPEIMDVAIGKDDEAHILGMGIGTCLLFTDEGILLLTFGF